MPVIADDANGRRNLDYIRAHFWRVEGGVPKCNSCWSARSKMPTGTNIPIGLDHHDVLPCGCRYDEAMMEQHLCGVGAVNYRTADNHPIVSHARSQRAYASNFGRLSVASTVRSCGMLYRTTWATRTPPGCPSATSSVRRDGADDVVEGWSDGV